MKWIAFVLVACADPVVTIDEYPCPPAGTQLTYESFGRTFFSTNCNDCHSASGDNRYGAPGTYRFETLDDVRNLRDRIFARAAATNTSMPPGPEDPNPDARAQLAEWLACGAP